MAVITAPAGYGKSTLLRLWQATDDRPFVWVSVDRRHDESTMLIGAIAAALDELEPLDDRVFAPLMAARPNLWAVVIPRLCEALQTREKQFVLVLDDLHRVHDHLSLEPLATIAEQMPSGSQIAIASREDLAIPLGRLRTQRAIVELQAGDLAMTRAEVGELMTGLGVRLSETNLQRLFDRTEGWPAGAYLAALVLGAADDPDAACEAFSGDERLVAEYLREEFIANLPAEHRQFLTETSIIDRLSGPICDDVLEREDSGLLLKRLSRSNLLLTPLDNQDREYRLHSLLREVLIADLRLDPKTESTMHARASAWYSRQGDIEHAIPHAIESGDEDLAAGLIWANAAEFESSGRGALLQRWLGQFSDAQVAASPPLAMARATGHVTRGDGAGTEHWTAVAMEELRRSSHPDAEALLITGRILRATAAAREGVVAMRNDVEEAYELLPEDSPWRSVCCILEGASWHLNGDLEQARRWLEEGHRRGLAQAPNVGVLCMAQLSLVASDEGEEDESLRLADEAMEAADHFGLGDDSTSALAFAAAGLAQARRGRADKADKDLRVAAALLDGLNDFSPWYEAETRIVIARALLLLDDVTGARARLAEAGRFVHRSRDAPVLNQWTEAAWKDAEASRAVSGRWPLSPAELRLLHFLPTHLSLREIAGELFVSPNTVKSHSRAVYRKLGVSSRAEAVACARQAGLLDEGAPLPRPRQPAGHQDRP
ncbi:MAG: LuxR C-terminal-related transcriptional regulator [Solirubrobacterales bacterium]